MSSCQAQSTQDNLLVKTDCCRDLIPAWEVQDNNLGQVLFYFILLPTTLPLSLQMNLSFQDPAMASKWEDNTGGEGKQDTLINTINSDLNGTDHIGTTVETAQEGPLSIRL